MKHETQLQMWEKIAHYIIATEDCCRDRTLKEGKDMMKEMYTKLRATFKITRINKLEDNNKNIPS